MAPPNVGPGQEVLYEPNSNVVTPANTQKSSSCRVGRAKVASEKAPAKHRGTHGHLSSLQQQGHSHFVQLLVDILVVLVVLAELGDKSTIGQREEL